MKLAVSTWNNLVAPVFDVSGRILLVQISANRLIPLEHKEISGNDNLAGIRRLSSLGMEALICGAISRLCHDILTTWGIQVISYITGPWDSVLQALVEGRLESPEFCMPGCPGYMQSHNRKAVKYVLSAMEFMNTDTIVKES